MDAETKGIGTEGEIKDGGWKKRGEKRKLGGVLIITNCYCTLLSLDEAKQ